MCCAVTCRSDSATEKFEDEVGDTFKPSPSVVKWIKEINKFFDRNEESDRSEDDEGERLSFISGSSECVK